MADIVRAAAAAYCASHRLAGVHRRALADITACRTAAAGATHLRCGSCGADFVRYHSCGNRHCPKCQTLAKERWLAARAAELLPLPYFHVVFTLPHALNVLIQANPRQLYDLLFAAVSATLLEFGRNARWLGAEIGATLVLHTWGQNLSQHVHVHALVAGGGLAPDGAFVRAGAGFLFPVKALSQVFRGKFVAGLEALFAKSGLRLPQDLGQEPARRRFLADLRRTAWVVYAKRPFAGAQAVLQYLGRYTHRIAISNNRLVSFDGREVRFRWRDYAHGNRRGVMRLSVGEFLRRFLLHVLPAGFTRIRHIGFMANRRKAQCLAKARAVLALPEPPPPATETVAEFMLRVSGTDPTVCPLCGAGRLAVISIQPPLRAHRAPDCDNGPLRASARAPP
ncbi:MAG: IS91 family transposase [Rhodocyclaceae bacterium]|nr:IS91 family transposase [Rhodocyclaceae bacterium]